MNIILVQTERDGKLYGQRFLQSANGHVIRLKKNAVRHLVQSRMRMAKQMNRAETTVNNVVEALFSPATFSY